jgi:Fe-S-cluster containining protein
MADGKNVPALEILHSNLSDFFTKFEGKYGSHMQCGSGCSKCCIGGLTVFPVEAGYIAQWFENLSDAERQDLRKVWSAEGSDSLGDTANACSFLHAGRCSIYPARPSLCRAQGLPLKVPSDSADKENKNYELSLCKLNFQDESSIPPAAEWLDLERVNILLSVAEKFSKKDEIHESLKGIAEPRSGRISLSNLREHLLHKKC